MLILKISTLAAFIVAAIWAFNRPEYDSVGAAVTAFAALAAVFFVDSKNKNESGGQSQKIERGSVGIQAGRNANKNKINRR